MYIRVGPIIDVAKGDGLIVLASAGRSERSIFTDQRCLP